MKPYGNQQGYSGVAFYEDGTDFIRIVFGASPDVVYVYDFVEPGPEHVGAMKRLAAEGRGLSTYISQHVRDRYRRKESR